MKAKSAIDRKRARGLAPAPRLPLVAPLAMFIGGVSVLGVLTLAWLVANTTWTSQTVFRTGLFTSLILLAGLFPVPVGPRVKAGLTTTPLLAAVLLLPPGPAALAAGVGTLAYQFALRLRPESELHLPWYKYPFNTGEAIITAGTAAAVFQALGGGLLSAPAVVAATLTMYMLNTGLISAVVSVQTGMNGFYVWWVGTRQTGAAEASLFGFGYVGSIVFLLHPWTLAALAIPVGVIYVAFSRLARSSIELEKAFTDLQELQGRLVSTSKLASIGAFSLDLAHQLRNPLFVVIGRLEGVRDGTFDSAMANQHVSTALGAAWRMQQLIESFVESGRRRWVPIDVTQLMEEALEIATLRNSKAIEVFRHYAPDMPSVQGNPVLLREALSNVMSNAFEATPKDGNVAVYLRPTDGGISVKVTDSGPGIAPQLLSRLFEPFQTSKVDGLGLGMFSAKHIVELHRGDIQVESSPEGTEVTIQLPLALGEERIDNLDLDSSQSDGDAEDPAQSFAEAMTHTT